MATQTTLQTFLTPAWIGATNGVTAGRSDVVESSLSMNIGFALAGAPAPASANPLLMLSNGTLAWKGSPSATDIVHATISTSYAQLEQIWAALVQGDRRPIQMAFSNQTLKIQAEWNTWNDLTLFITSGIFASNASGQAQLASI